MRPPHLQSKLRLLPGVERVLTWIPDGEISCQDRENEAIRQDNSGMVEQIPQATEAILLELGVPAIHEEHSYLRGEWSGSSDEADVEQAPSRGQLLREHAEVESHAQERVSGVSC